MTDLSHAVTGPTEIRPILPTTPVQTRTEQSKLVSKKPPAPPPPPEVLPPDKLKLSPASQAKLLRQHGLNPSEIGANLGLTEQQVHEALESAETLTAALTSALKEKS